MSLVFLSHGVVQRVSMVHWWSTNCIIDKLFLIPVKIVWFMTVKTPSLSWLDLRSLPTIPLLCLHIMWDMGIVVQRSLPLRILIPLVGWLVLSIYLFICYWATLCYSMYTVCMYLYLYICLFIQFFL